MGFLRRGPPLGVGGTPPDHAYHVFIGIAWTRDAAQTRRWGAFPPLAKAGRVSVAIHVECGGIVDSVGLGHFCFMVYERAFHRIRPSALRDEVSMANYAR